MPVRTATGDHGIPRFAARLGLASWQVRLAWEHGLLPGPDLEGAQWSVDLAQECAGGTARIVAAFGEEPPVGAGRAAERLARALGLDVERVDVEVLVARGELKVISRYRDYPVYLLSDLDRLDPRAVSDVVSARKGPLLDTVDARSAAKVLGWPRKAFDRIAAERELPVDQLSRYALADIRALSADRQLADRVREDRRRAALSKASKDEARVEDVVRGWLLRCTAYLDGDVEEPPDTAAARRALRALADARAATAQHSARTDQ